MTYRDIAKSQLRIDEGCKAKPYRDTVGKLTAGIGRNLDDVGLRDNEIALMLENDVQAAESVARSLVPRFDALTDNRKAVLLNMAFNLGPRLSAFTETLRHVNAEDFDKASESMLDSLWAKQVGARAERLSKQMKEG